MTRRQRLMALAVLLLAAAVALLLWPGEPAAPAPSAPPPAPPRAGPLDTFRSPAGGLAPSARLVPVAPAPRQPCVRGRVLSAATSAGIAGARVVLASEAGALTAESGAGGAFGLEAPAGHLWLAELTAPGYRPFRPAWGHSPVELTLAPGTCVSELTLTLSPERTYRGLVLDPAGAPVAGAAITVGTPDEAPEGQRTSAADGTFTFSAPPGAVLVARHPRFAPAVVQVDFRVEATGEVVLRLGPRPEDGGPEEALLSGLVLDASDAGVPGARVTARQWLAEGADRLERVEGWAESDPEGRFVLRAAGPGPWTLEAHLPGSRSEPKDTRGEPVVLRLSAGAELRGTVRDGAGRAVQSFTVLVARRLGPLQLDREEARHLVDAAGAFRLRGLPVGPARVVVAAVGYAPSEPREVTLAAGAPAEVAVTLREGGAVAGRVVDRADGGPLPGAQVSLEGGAEVAVVPVAHADGDGGFLLAGVAPGPRSLFASAEGHHARLLSVAVREGQTAGPLVVDLAPLDPGETPRLELVGIGAVLQARGDALVLTQVVPGGGAAEVGLVPGDAILAIDGEAAAGLGFAGGVERIRGTEGSVVQLRVRLARDGTVVEVPTPRRRLAR